MSGTVVHMRLFSTTTKYFALSKHGSILPWVHSTNLQICKLDVIFLPVCLRGPIGIPYKVKQFICGACIPEVLQTNTCIYIHVYNYTQCILYRVLPRAFRHYRALRVPKLAIHVNGQRYALIL